jgi:hypothetical protein
MDRESKIGGGARFCNGVTVANVGRSSSPHAGKAVVSAPSTPADSQRAGPALASVDACSYRLRR